MSNKNNQKGKQKQYTVITILAIVVILSVTLVGIYFTKNKPKEDEKTLAYTDLIKEMSAGNIEKIEMIGQKHPNLVRSINRIHITEKR